MAWESFNEMFHQIIDKPIPSLTIVLNLILVESLLSVDNAAVLATMVLDLPKDDRKKALRYGILGAYFFRGVCLFFASLLIRLWWFKPLGGLYLLVLAIKHFYSKSAQEHKDPQQESKETKRSWLYQKTLGLLGPFWATVVLVELMDIAFSIDNVIAANAYTDNVLLVCTGVFIGILAMRFVAQGFVKLMERYSFLETCAYLVIGILGVKLLLSLLGHYMPCSAFSLFLEGPDACLEAQGKKPPEGAHSIIWGDLLTSLLSMGIFILPVLSSMLFNFPKKNIDK